MNHAVERVHQQGVGVFEEAGRKLVQQAANVFRRIDKQLGLLGCGVSARLLVVAHRTQGVLQRTRNVGQRLEAHGSGTACQRVGQGFGLLRHRLVALQRPFGQPGAQATRPLIGLIEVHVVQLEPDPQRADHTGLLIGHVLSSRRSRRSLQRLGILLNGLIAAGFHHPGLCSRHNTLGRRGLFGGKRSQTAEVDVGKHLPGVGHVAGWLWRWFKVEEGGVERNLLNIGRQCNIGAQINIGQVQTDRLKRCHRFHRGFCRWQGVCSQVRFNLLNRFDRIDRVGQPHRFNLWLGRLGQGQEPALVAQCLGAELEGLRLPGAFPSR